MVLDGPVRVDPVRGRTVTETVTVVAVRELLGRPELGLKIIAGATGLGNGVSWAHVSELVDPTEFLNGGELLLLTGVNLPEGAQAQRTYVTRLAGAGVAAIGFGIGLAWDEVPAPLTAAAESSGLPLLEVPRAVPFLAITRAVAAEIGRQEQAAADRLTRAQRALTAAAVGRGGQTSLLDELIRLTGGWGLLLNRAGVVLASSPQAPAEAETLAHRGALTGDLARLREARGPASLVASSGDSQVWVQSLHAGSELLGFLAVGRDRPLEPLERQMVNTAVPLGILLLDRAGTLGRGARRLRTSVLRLLLAGQVGLVDEVVGELWHGLPAQPVRLLVGLGGRNALITGRERLAADRAVAAARIVYGELDGELVAVCAAGGSDSSDSSDVEAVLHAVRGIDGLRVGVSEPAPFDDLGRAAGEARQAAAYGTGAGTRVSWFRDVPRLGLLELLPDGTAAEFSAAVLRPLRAEPTGTRGDLLHSLKVWLAHHGQWDPAAAELGVHRHTLRNRVRKAERMLGRELDSPDLRAELWLALRLDERADPSPRP